MDFKLDLKLPNEVDLSISKNEQPVVFATHQTDSMFILTFDLKRGGYGRKDIKIEINEDGSRMTISGERPNMRGFQKTFIIPEGVALDKVKARFDQHEPRLTIRMPKLVKGEVTGNGIQEFRHPTDKQTEKQDAAAEEEEEIKAESHVENASSSDEEEKKPTHVKEEEEKSNSYNYSNTTIIAGTTLLASLVVVFFGFIRSKSESTKKTN